MHEGPRQTANRFPRRNTSPDRRIPPIVAFPRSHGTSLMLFPESTSPPRIAGTLFALPASDPTGSPSLSMANDGGRHVILALDAMLPLLITPNNSDLPSNSDSAQQLRLGPATTTRPVKSCSWAHLAWQRTRKTTSRPAITTLGTPIWDTASVRETQATNHRGISLQT
jgi:hypothetical protein